MEAKIKTTAETRETFKDFLTSKGLRVTNQRLAIFDAAYEHPDHFTAEDLLERSRDIDDSVSRATVYRALPILTESGLIREVDVGRDYKFYMANRNATTFQAQVICLDCDKIFEIDAPFMEWYGKTVADKLSLNVESQRLQVTAHCEELKTAGICSRSGKKRK
jgi:Fe2+ or Zn2+ uptake regulation protein